MLYRVLMLVPTAMVAAVFGFTGMPAAATVVAKILFFVFLGSFLVSLVANSATPGSRRPLP